MGRGRYRIPASQSTLIDSTHVINETFDPCKLTGFKPQHGNSLGAQLGFDIKYLILRAASRIFKLKYQERAPD